MDNIDRRLLRQLQISPDLPLSELAERSGLTQSTAGRRIQRMKEAGIIKAIRRQINWRHAGWEIAVSLRIQLDKSEPNSLDIFNESARNIPEVLEIQSFLGTVDVRLKVIARDMQHWQQLYREKILRLPYIVEIEALMHLAEIKRSEEMPL